MVTGRKAFEGKSQASLIAAIVSATDSDLDIRSRPCPRARLLVKRCLAKDPESAWQTATDLRVELSGSPGRHGRWRSPRRVPSSEGRAPMIAQLRARGGSLLLAAVMAVLAFMSPRVSGGAAEETRFLSTVPDMPALEAVSISPDGRWIAYSAREGGHLMSLFVRPIGLESVSKAGGARKARADCSGRRQPLDRVRGRHAEED